MDKPPAVALAPFRSDPLRGCRRLACAVIHQALEDLEGNDPERTRAEVFFFGDSTLFCFWCELAGVDPEGIREHFKKTRGFR